MIKNIIIAILIISLICLVLYKKDKSDITPIKPLNTYSIVNSDKGVFKINHTTGQVYYFINSIFVELKTFDRDELDNLVSQSKPNSLLNQY